LSAGSQGNSLPNRRPNRQADRALCVPDNGTCPPPKTSSGFFKYSSAFTGPTSMKELAIVRAAAGRTNDRVGLESEPGKGKQLLV
jgi:hypothetical protein